MTIKHVGEFNFISSLKSHLKGIGDDCAVLPYKDNQVLLVTTDALVEGVHFIFDKTSAYDLGSKAMAVNLSDIAAMGGAPFAVTVTLSMPSTMPMKWLEEFYQGLTDMAEKAGTEIVGGDTTSSPGPLFISLTVLGTMDAHNVKRRSTAQTGDIICTTGYVGSSGAGLKALLEGIDSPLIHMHHRPTPHLAEGAFLSKLANVHAMMDLSDGIASDAHRIAEESLVEVIIDPERLPLSPELKKLCESRGWNAIEMGLNGGEDYCLFLTVAPDAFKSIAEAFEKHFHRPLYEIGKIGPSGTPSVTYLGKPLNVKGFSHFS